ncbi:CRISPR-associated protein Cas5 [Candidatus Poribacteria bacterium]|nr:CRISPR-associated protein Cas5 [Candidatus Poribacteria bacterium]
MEQNIDRILVMDLHGAMAHFRAFYTNSSSLTYSFPPRTVITGLLAGIMGYPRDSYYREFSKERCRIALSIISPFRKIMNTINYLWAKSSSDFVVRAGNPLQVQFESLIPGSGLKEWGELVYRIYIWHSDQGILDNLAKRVRENKYVYPPYMGISEFIAELESVDDIHGDDIEVLESDQHQDFATVINTDLIADRGLEFKSGVNMLQYLKEIMPVEFNADRSSRATGSFVFEKNLSNIRAIMTKPFVRIKGKNIAFMETDYE